MSTCVSLARLFAIVALPAVCQSAIAQVYTWKDPETGATKISNLRPAWFRSEQPKLKGPRTLMLLNGKVIDDSGLKSTAEQQARIGQQLARTARLQAEEARLKQVEEAQSELPAPADQAADDKARQ